MMINGLNHPSDLFVFSSSKYIFCPLHLNFFIVLVLAKCFRIFSLKKHAKYQRFWKTIA